MQIYKYAEKHGLNGKELLKKLKVEGFKVTPLNKITDEMIAKIGDVSLIEAVPEPAVSRETTPEPKAVEPITDGKKIYHSDSERLTFGGFKPEKRGDGYIVPDESIQFDNHFFITTDKDKQRFIEITDAFKLKKVTIVSEKEYHGFMKALAERRQQMRETATERAGRQG